MIDYNQARLNPARVFKHPKQVLTCEALTDEQKKIILQSWEYDERELAVAEEENMLSDNKPQLLDVIQNALQELHALPLDAAAAVNKQGGRIE